MYSIHGYPPVFTYKKMWKTPLFVDHFANGKPLVFMFFPGFSTSFLCFPPGISHPSTVTNSQTPAVPPDWPSRCSPQGMKQRRNRGTPCSWWLPKMTRMTLWIICGLEIEYEKFIDSYLLLNSHLPWQTNISELVNNQRLPVIFWTLLRVSPLRVDIRTSCTDDDSTVLHFWS